MDTNPKKLLVVDDDNDLIALLKQKLETTGKYSVVCTTKGTDAVATALKESPDLILLDINMPVMDGGDVRFALSEDKGTCDIPILYHSSLVTEEEVEEADGVIGGDQMVSKSGSFETLVRRIDECLK